MDVLILVSLGLQEQRLNSRWTPAWMKREHSRFANMMSLVVNGHVLSVLATNIRKHATDGL